MKVFLYSAMKVFLYCNEGILSIIKGLQLRYSHIHTYIHKNTERMPPKFRAQALPDVGGHREQKKRNTGRLPLKFRAKALPEVGGHCEREVSGRVVHRQTDGL
jgi:hypothetical protein